MNTLPLGTHYGQVLRQLELSDVLLTELSDHRGGDLPMHRHEAAHLCFVLSGDYVAFDGAVARRHPPRSVLLYPGGSIHRDQIHPAGGTCLTIELSSSLQSEFALDAGTRGHRIVASNPLSSWAAMRLWSEMRRKHHKSRSTLRDLALEITGQLLDEVRDRPPASPWLREAHAAIAAHPASPLNLTRLAADAGVHPGHLTRSFRASYGMTPRDFQRRCRIDQACRALGGSHVPIVDIAADAGYAEQSSFARSFRQLTGMTPLDFRRQAQAALHDPNVRFGQDRESSPK